MSQSRLSAIRQELGRLNTEATGFRRTIADKKSTAQQVKEARTAFDKIDFGGEGHTVDNPAAGTLCALVAERDQIVADNEREARMTNLNADLTGTGRPGEDQIGAPGVSRADHIRLYDAALRRHGVQVIKRAGQLTFKNLALEHVHSDVRSTVEQLNDRFFGAFKRYMCAVATGDPARAAAEDREIVFGRHEEFRGFLLGGPGIDDKEKRDMGIGTLSLGGYFVPKGFVYDVEEALKYYGPMLLTSEIMDTATGQPLPYPTDNDTTIMGELVGEGQQVTEKDVSIGQVLFNAWKFSSKMVKLSLELMQDSAFDMESYLKKKLAIRIGRIYNNQFTVGTGTNAPNGIVTAVVAACGTPSTTPWAAVQTGYSNGYGIPLIAAGSSTNDGGAETGGTSIGSQDLDNLEHTVDPLYRRGAAYMFHDQTLRRIKVLLDKYGRPLWKPSVASGDPDRINDYPFYINNDMTPVPATAGANNNTVLFGQLDKYVIRRVKELGIITLRERFADYGQLALIGFSRADGQLLDAGTHPICYLQQASS
jgi:HK97 family phage major capsid protein